MTDSQADQSVELRSDTVAMAPVVVIRFSRKIAEAANTSELQCLES
jgi:hypothetical protein